MIRKTFTLLVPALLLLAACGDDDGAETARASASASGSASGSAASEGAGCEVVNGSDAEHTGEIHVALTEFAIEVEEDAIDAGAIKVEAMNAGSEDHEVVILEGPMSDVEFDHEHGVDESGLVGEIEGFPAGKECAGTFELAAGTYTLLCAIADEDGHNHYEEGMVTEIEVG